MEEESKLRSEDNFLDNLEAEIEQLRQKVKNPSENLLMICNA